MVYVVVTEDAREWLRRVQGADVRRVRVFLADDGQRTVFDSITPHRGWDAQVSEHRAEESFSTCVIQLADLRRVGGVVLIRAEGAAEATLDENDSDLMELGLGCCEREVRNFVFLSAERRRRDA